MTDRIYFKIKTEATTCGGKDFSFTYIGKSDSKKAYQNMLEKLEELGRHIYIEYVESDFGSGISISLMKDSDDPEDLDGCDINEVKNICDKITQNEYFSIAGWPERISDGGLITRTFDLSNPAQEAEWLGLRKGLITSSVACSCIKELFYNPNSGAAEWDDEPEYLQGHIMTPYAFYHALRGNYEPPEMKKGMLARLKLGLALEPVIAKIIADKLDAEYGAGHVVVKNNDFIYHEKYRVGSSYDYLIIAGPLVEKFGGIGNLEIKTVDSFVFWKKWKTDDGVLPPISYRYQTLFQAGLLSQRNTERGTPECKFIVLAYMQNMEVDYVLYEHNPEESAWVVQQAVRFWEEVDAEREPDMTMCVDYELYASMDSGRRTGEGKMKAEEVPDDLRELAIAAYRASKDQKTAEERRVELAAKFMQACPTEYKGVMLREDDPLASVTISRSEKRASSLKFNEKPKGK